VNKIKQIQTDRPTLIIMRRLEVYSKSLATCDKLTTGNLHWPLGSFIILPICNPTFYGYLFVLFGFICILYATLLTVGDKVPC